MTAAAAQPDGAVERTIDLLSENAAPRGAERGLNDAGYLDLLDRELESTGPTQDLMVTRLVPSIYERYWRPALGRLAKGMTGPGMAEEVRIARLLLGLGDGDTVLDVACGPGNFTRAFARTVGPHGLAVGIDASRTMLERGAEELREAAPDNVTLVRGDATTLPFRDGSFDGVCCFAALHLFSEPFAALDEMRRVLRVGGRIAVLTSVRRPVTPAPLKPLIESVSGMRVFEGGEIVEALENREFTEIHQRLSGLVQFVGGRLARG